MVNLNEFKFRLFLHNAELANSVIHLNLGISHCIYRHTPDVVVATVRIVNDAYVLTDDVHYTNLGDALRGAITLSRNYAQAY